MITELPDIDEFPDDSDVQNLNGTTAAPYTAVQALKDVGRGVLDAPRTLLDSVMALPRNLFVLPGAVEEAITGNKSKLFASPSDNLPRLIPPTLFDDSPGQYPPGSTEEEKRAMDAASLTYENPVPAMSIGAGGGLKLPPVPAAGPSKVMDVAQAVGRPINQLVSEFSGVENIATAVGGPNMARALAAMFGGGMAAHAPTSIQERITRAQQGETMPLEASVGSIIDLALPALLLRGAASQPRAASTLRPGETGSSLTTGDIADIHMGEIVPPSRQINAPPTRMDVARQRITELPDSPTETTFTAGPRGVAAEPMTVADRFETAQRKPVAGLLRAPATEMGQTTLAQTLRDVANQLEGAPPKEGAGPVEPVTPKPTSSPDAPIQSTRPGFDQDILKYRELDARRSQMLEDGSFMQGDNFSPEYTSTWKELENIKNKYGGMPPETAHTSPLAVESMKKGEVPKGGDQSGNKEKEGQTILRGGIPAFDPEVWKDAGDFVSQAAKIVVERFPRGDAKIDRQQMVNTVRNKLGAESSEWKLWQERGIEGAKVGTPTEMRKWMEDNGPKVEVRKFGKSILSQEEKDYNLLRHQFDSLTETERNLVSDIWNGVIDPATARAKFPEIKQDTIMLGAQLRKLEPVAQQARDARAGNEQSHWQSIAPKPEADMPGYVEIAVVKPQRLPKLNDPDSIKSEAIQFPSSHNFPPNTLGFVRGYMETTPQGKKVFHVIEVQSDWAQQMREIKEQEKSGQYGGFENKQQGDALLAHYERLALKAAIEHARKEGADAIAISDAETAMMTEGHDRAVLPQLNIKATSKNVAHAKRLISGEGRRLGEGSDYLGYDSLKQLADGNDIQFGRTQIPHDKIGEIWEVESKQVVPQEPGMRLHYDQTLPKIAEELTGVKGERGTFGRHRMAFEGQDVSGEFTDNPLTKTRKDLIFRNEAGELKTDVSARVFDISKFKARRETGEPMTTMGKTYGGLPFLDPDFWRSTKGVVGGIQKLKPYAEERVEANTAQGVGKIPGLSRLLDPRSYRKSPEEQSLHAHEYQIHKGQQMTALWLESRKRTKRAFEVDEKTNQVTLEGGKKDYLGDVVEAEMRQPGSQPLNATQKKFVQWWTKQLEAINEELKKEGVEYYTDDAGDVIKVGDAYFPRPAIGKAGKVDKAPRTIQRVVGAKRFFQHKRKFDTERLGVEEGEIKYESDEYGRVGRFLEAAYRAIADQRLANDPVLKGQKGKPEFMESSMVYHPAFRGRVFPAETARQINEYYQRQPGRELKVLSEVNDFVKTMQFTADVSTPLNQGLPLLGINPIRWGRATLASYRALLDDKVLSKYISEPENLQAAQDIVGNGGSISHLYDFLQGARKGKLAEKIPPIRASARSMATFLAVAKIEMYKAFKVALEKKGGTKAELVEAVENAVFSGRMESIGVSPSRAMAERLLFNAPSYMRAAANLTAQIGQGKISGAVARRAMIGLATSILLTQYVIGRMQVDEGTMTEDEFKRTFNPQDRTFMRFPVELSTSNGQVPDRVQASYGNIMLSLARKIGQLSKDPENLGELGPKNPAVSFGSARLSPLIQTGKEILTGEDYRGEKTTPLKAVGRTLTPISVQNALDKSSGKQKAANAAFSTVGMQSFSESFTDRRHRVLNLKANELYKKPYSELTMVERAKVEVAAKPSLPRDKPTEGQIAQALEAQRKLAERVTKELDPAVQEKLSAAGLTVSGYRQSKTIYGNEFRLNGEEEKERFQQAVVRETNKRLRNILSHQNFIKMSQEEQQSWVNKVSAMAHEAAWKELESYTKSKRVKSP